MTDALRNLLAACRARGKEVITMIMATPPSGTETTKQHLSVTPTGRQTVASAVCVSLRRWTKGSRPGLLPGEREEDFFSLQTGHPSGCNTSKPLNQPGSPSRNVGTLKGACLPWLKRLRSAPWGLIGPSMLTACTHQDDTHGGVTKNMSDLSFSQTGLLSRTNSIDGKDPTLFPSVSEQVLKLPASPALLF